MRPRLAQPAIVLVCLMALTACVGVSKRELQALGSTITPTKIDFVELTAYAGRAKAAYAEEAVIRGQYPATVRVSAPGKTDAQYFIERDDRAKVQYIAIRGTANRKNLIEDVEMRIREDLALAIPVHAGFDATARVLYADMKPYLKPGYRTYITGHSLGGALAALLAIHMVEDGYKVDRVITFGQPKFTTTDGVGRLGFLSLTRVVDENDIVPMLPPTTIVNRVYGVYEHAGPEIILLEGPHYVFLPTHDADRISIGEFGRSLNFANLKDHHMDNYLNRLSLKAKGAVEVSYDERENYVAAKKKVASN
ncbi:lipase family protein [Mesorhizobium sp. YM1C-6-2]|nr:lipase family protein [Mesorhizobium sp. YM1C-6-2]